MRDPAIIDIAADLADMAGEPVTAPRAGAMIWRELER
jgi:hypothetical protein